MKYRPYQIVHEWGDDIGAQLAQLQAYGVGGIVTNTAWNDGYLTDPAAFGNLAATLASAKELGFGLWLYDESGYPSGSAGGLTLDGHPELEATGIRMVTVTGSGAVQAAQTLPPEGIRFVAAWLYPAEDGGRARPEDGAQLALDDDTSLRWTGLTGAWVMQAFVEQRLFEGSHAANNGWKARRYPNLLDRRAVARFIEVTYEAYARHLGDALGGIDAIFTDEPSLMAAYQNTEETFACGLLPWCDELPSLYNSLYGRELLPLLGSLFEGDGIADRTVRAQFAHAVSELLAANYFRQIADWCAAHGVRLSGHALLEESLVYHTAYYGNLMRVIREMQVPGCDMLTTRPRTYMHDPFGYFLAPKFVSSAARAAGRSEVMAEICPVVFSPSGAFELDTEATLQDMQGTAGLLYFSGVTQINSYYSFDVVDKAVYAPYCEYVGRMGAMLDGAKHMPDVGVYYPIETAQALYKPIRRAVLHQPQALWDDHDRLVQLTRGLFEARLDFNFLDADAVLGAESAEDGEAALGGTKSTAVGEAAISAENATAEDGSAKLPGGSAKDGRLIVAGIPYRAIVMPDMDVIPLAVLERLSLFADSGGRLTWTGRLPFMGVRDEEHAEVQRLMKRFATSASVSASATYCRSDAAANRERLTAVPAADDVRELYVSRYRKQDGAEMLMVLNAGPEECSFAVESGYVQALVSDPATGTQRVVALPHAVPLGGNQCVFVTGISDAR